MSGSGGIVGEYIPANKYVDKAAFGAQNVCNLHDVTGTMANYQDMTSDTYAQEVVHSSIHGRGRRTA